MSNIKVAVRVRPPIESVQRSGDQPSWITRENTIYMESGKINTFYTFDHVFDSTSTNRDVYDKYCHPIVESVMQGFNGTIFAFGQTSSGKTHTMMGTTSQPGLIPLAINAIFNIIENVPEREYLIRISYIEIYNENIMDLLDTTCGKNLQIRDNADGQPIIVDLTELTVGSKEEIQTAMNAGERLRHVASTVANQRSSRSHTIFRMVIESSLRDDGGDRAVTVGQLNLVDLAGSERSEQCGEAGERFRESTRINLSLTFLTQVISKLSRGDRGHVSFRDSKLTRILRNSLGGNAHTAIVCTVNPFCADQTLRTLQFASSAKKIKNTPTVNETVSNDTQLRRYHQQIEELTCQIKAMEDKDLCRTLQEKNALINELNSKIRSLQEKLVVSTLPAPSVTEWRKQRRETWAAPSALWHDLPKPRAPSEGTTLFEPLDVFQECGRLSTVIEENESFHAISTSDFEKHLQREEQTRRSAALLLGGSEPTPQTCNVAACAEKIKFLENELMLMKKEYDELKELTTQERLMCNTSRRPVSSGKLDEARSTLPLPIQLKACCVEAVLTSKRCQERVSHRPGGFEFFSPVYASPMLTSADGNSSTSSSTHEDQEEDCVQASKQCARLTPRTTLWTPGHSPVVGTPGTPGLNPLTRTPQACNQPMSKPLCVHGAAQTEDVQCIQAFQHLVTSCTQTHEDSMSQKIVPVVEASCQTDSEDGCEKPRLSTSGQTGVSAAEPPDHCAVQCNSLVQNCKTRERAIDAVDCEAQTVLSVQECTVQTELSLLHRYVADYGVQAMPSMLDAATEIDQVSTLVMLDVSVQTVSPCSHDRSMQSESCVPSEAVADSEVQAVPFTIDSASQVNSSLESQEISTLESTRLSFVMNDSSRIDKSLVSQVWTPSGNGSSSHWHKSRGGKVWAAVRDAVRAGLPESSGGSVGSKTLISDGKSTPLLSCSSGVANSQIKTFASGTLATATETEDQVPRFSQVEASMQPKSSCDKSIQSVLSIPRSAAVDRDVQALPSTSDCASQVNVSLASREVSTSESAQYSANLSTSQLQKSLVSGSAYSAPKHPEYSTCMSASGNNPHPEQRYHYRGKVIEALRASMLKPVEESTTSSGSQKVPSPCLKSAASSFQSGTTAPEIRTWLHHNQKMKESVSVQAETLDTQEVEDLRHQVSSLKLSLDAHEQALRGRESQLKLQAKAAKKRELQLKAVIRQLQNKETGHMARAAAASPIATASAKDKALRPPLPARALVHESPSSLAQLLKTMTPRAREGARLIYFGQSLEEQAVAEQVQVGQLRASLSSHARKLESARKRQQAWADLRSDSKHTKPHSPLKELDNEPGQEIKEPAGSLKDDTVDDMALWPPMQYFMDPDKENTDFP
ncbi:uncharacterized protein LOC144125494 [Amblyomma americanum]